jgi:hypothetical protein
MIMGIAEDNVRFEIERNHEGFDLNLTQISDLLTRIQKLHQQFQTFGRYDSG